MSQICRNSSQPNELLNHHDQLIHLDDLVIDRENRRVKTQKQWFRLKPLEFELLMFFVRHIGIVVSREQILKTVWGQGYMSNSRTLDVHIRWLREKIEQDPANPKRIITMRRIGYRFDG
ncbi:response regulator transcription factor [Chloroflexi bacterium TSY]|nr:response regulator transcription factor [Chloroflexi bacterium TSY]